MCPSCSEPLIAFELDGIEVDHCLGCLGTWLDAGEIEAIAMRAGTDHRPIIEAIAAGDVLGRSHRKCPRCRRRMRTLRIAGPATLELDCCPSDHGLWFDQGELKTLVASFANTVEAAIAEFFADFYRSELAVTPKGG